MLPFPLIFPCVSLPLWVRFWLFPLVCVKALLNSPASTFVSLKPFAATEIMQLFQMKSALLSVSFSVPPELDLLKLVLSSVSVWTHKLNTFRAPS